MCLCMYTLVTCMSRRIFLCNDTATTEIYTYLHTLSLHDALPICLFLQLRSIMRVYASTRPAAGHGAPVGRFAARHRKVTFCSRPIDRPDWRDIGVQRRKFGDQSPGKATVDIEAVLSLAMRAALGRTRQCRTSNRLWKPSSHARLADIARRRDRKSTRLNSSH